MNIQNIHKILQQQLQQYQGNFAYVISHDSSKIEHNSSVITSSASTIKIPLLIEALRQCEEGRLHLGMMISIPKRDIVGGAGVLQSLVVTSLSLRDLLALMIIVSDNTATNLVIDVLGLEQIKNGYKRIGLHSTSVQRKMMDFESLKNGKDNLISAEDLHKCLLIINEPSILRKDSQKVMHEMLEKQQFREKLPYYMDESLMWIGNKTGELPGVEHDCAIIKYGPHTVYAVILCSDLEQQQDGKQLIRVVGQTINEYLVSLMKDSN
ncbi:serine hydrolase [Bacillus massiliigorillae]|uniref:serine hydrolase n=1 Tax=Bacillus massiliigorillae TaxID=1243664 RepID=UPI0003A49224|nr:serine hydrolase [Bacillus massiliigorillae]